ncbi:MAG: hypothetical protein LBQ60_11345 [Bacteroidales bacterium]|jgi:hypothetical protein|nr:hypothetical protein [Bacteroidales bacterium]
MQNEWLKYMNYIISKEVEYQTKLFDYEKMAYTSCEMGISDRLYGKNEIIVSLTTYGKRIYDVPVVIESLFSQTIKANKIILWLAKDEFCENNLPVSLKKMRNRGLIIEFCKDLKSYKKLIPALIAYPSASIITVDDDVIYARDFIERFVHAYLATPDVILFGRGHRISFTEEGVLKPYDEWKPDISEEDISHLNFPTGIGGILYPPQSLNAEVTNEQLFMRLAPSADDIWTKAMALLCGTPAKKIHIPVKFEEYCTIIRRSQDLSLYFINIHQKGNDKQIAQVFNHYNLWNKIREL